MSLQECEKDRGCGSGQRVRGRQKDMYRSEDRGTRRRGGVPSTLLMVALLLAGAGIMAYPTFSDWWNSYHQTRAIAGYVSAVEEADQARIDELLAEAHAYNERLATQADRYRMSEGELSEYQATLDITGTGIMGYVQVASLGIDYPIYHGTDESLLQVAVGHIEGTSLPVGGASTHAAISGHRGLPSARLFTDIDRLVEGDTFTVTVLGQTETYEVDQVRVVEPADLSQLEIEEGQDLCTLVTCTPYGINTHRLLVRGHRVTSSARSAVITAEAVQVPRYLVALAVGVPLLFVCLFVALAGDARGRDTGDGQLE